MVREAKFATQHVTKNQSLTLIKYFSQITLFAQLKQTPLPRQFYHLIDFSPEAGESDHSPAQGAGTRGGAPAQSRTRDTEGVVTLARKASLLVASVAQAFPNGHQPLPLRAAVHLGGLLLLGVVDTGAPHLHERLGVHGHRVWEHGQVLDGERALLEVHAHRHQGDARAHVLESQVEAFPADGPHLTDFCVQLEDSVAEVHLGEALVGCDGVNLCKLVLLELDQVVVIRLHVIEVEGLFAGAQHQGDAVAVPQGELELHIDLLSRVAWDPVCPQPIVLAVIHDIAHLVSSDWSVMLVNTTDLFPLDSKN